MRLIFYLWEVVLVLLGQESTVLIPKSYPNLLRIGSRIERLGVHKTAVNHLIFSRFYSIGYK